MFLGWLANVCVEEEGREGYSEKVTQDRKVKKFFTQDKIQLLRESHHLSPRL